MVSCPPVSKYKRYTKKDFLIMVENDPDLNVVEFKKMKINELRDFFAFTHKDNENGREIDARGYKCLDCLDVLRPDFRSNIDPNFCDNCL